MKSTRWIVISALFLLTMLLAAADAPATERSQIGNQYKWNLTAIYPNVAAANKAKEDILADSQKLTTYKGRLAESAATFKAGLDLYWNIELQMRKLESYGQRLADQDARVSENKALKSDSETIRTKFAAAASFIEPEICAADPKKLDGFFQELPALRIYRFPVSETLRRRTHVLSPSEEKIMAAANDVTDTPGSLYTLFSNADLLRNTIALADGSKATLDYATYDKLRQSLVESDRVAAFTAFMGEYDRFKKSFAEMLYGQMKVHRFVANSRNYPNTLAAALDGDGIDPKIYASLIEAAHRNLPTFHRYLKLKARALGKAKLDYTDMYAPFTKDVAIPMKYEEAQAILLEAVAPMGPEYVDTVKEAFHSGWIDVYPNEGKESGAYMDGSAYGVHPFLLLNYNDTYGEALTLAHEMGHAMHSFFSNKNQPFPTANYSTFVAEVASTFNENLVNDLMLKKVKTDEEKLYLLGHFLDESIKGTFFRQVQFAEFELLIHQKVEKGEALTDETLNKLYLDLARLYYGHDQGVVNVPDFIAVEWAVIPHFYYNYYVYQYSTSFAAASLLSQKIIKREPGALNRYYENLLRAGGSDNPVELLKRAGADMTKPEAYEALMARANRYMDQVERLLAKKKAK
jgi:oligoendopeptidase F